MAYAALSTIQTIATGQVFTAATLQQANDNDEFLVDPPACSVYLATTQTVATSTAATLLADTEYFDNNSMHSTVTNTGRITAQTAGRYLFFTTVSFPADADGSRRVDFRIDGTTSYECMNIASNSSVSAVTITGCRAFTLTAGQYVEVRIIHTAGNNLAVSFLEFGAMLLTR